MKSDLCIVALTCRTPKTHPEFSKYLNYYILGKTF